MEFKKCSSHVQNPLLNPKSKGDATSLDKILEALSAASRELSKLFGERFIGMVLFGSWARSEAKENSDVDVLVVLRDLRGMEVRSKIYKVITRYVERAVTLVDIRLEELLKKELELSSLMINIIADAIIISDRDDVIKSFIEKGRRLIEKAQLVRYRTPDGKYGWKRRNGRPIEPIEL